MNPAFQLIANGRGGLQGDRAQKAAVVEDKGLPEPKQEDNVMVAPVPAQIKNTNLVILDHVLLLIMVSL